MSTPAQPLQSQTLPKWAVQAPDGKVIQFPDNFTDADVTREMSKMYPQQAPNTGPATSLKPAPKMFSKDWFKQQALNATDAATNFLPAVGGTIGGIAGFPAGGPLGSVGGAGIGGMGGEAGKQILRRILGFGDAPNTPQEAAKRITFQGPTQAALEVPNATLPWLAGPLQKAATSQYERALAPTTKINKAITQDITPELIRRGETGSLEGLEKKAGQQISQLNPQLNQAYRQAGTPYNAPHPEYDVSPPGSPARSVIDGFESNKDIPSLRNVHQRALQVGDMQDANYSAQALQRLGHPIQTTATIPGAGSKVVQDLEALKQTYMPGGISAQPQAVGAIEGVQNIVKQYGNDVDPTTLRRLRQIFEDPVAQRGGYAGADLTTSYTLNAQKQAADSIRGILNKNPDIGALNKEISFWLDVQRVTSQSGLRRTGQAGGLLKVLAPLATGVAGAAGFATRGAQTSIEAGGIATLSALAIQMTRSSTWRTSSAVLKDRVASALARGSIGELTSLAARFGVTAQGMTNQGTQSIPSQNQPATP